MNRKNNVLKLSIFIICISIFLFGCGGYNKIAKEKYETEVKPQLLDTLRNETELDDLDIINPKLSYNTIINHETSKQQVTLNYHVGYFSSDKIDQYFTTKENDSNAIKLDKILNTIKDKVGGKDGVSYTYDIEGNVIKIKITTDADIRIKTSKGRLYTLKNYSEDVVNIDNNTVYSEEELQSSKSSYSNTKTNTTTSYRTVTDKDTLWEVWYIATEFVKDELKSPKSAEFPRYNDSNVEITSAGNSYKVIGYVDAQNSFGAMIRATFILVMEKNGDNYILKECNIID